MFAKTITYTDFNDVERTETFYFNLSKAEIAEMQLTTEGGLTEKLQKIIDSKDQAEIFKMFKYLILKAYGEKSPDGKRFIKNEELSEGFSQTAAFDEFFMELGTNSDAAQAFVNGIIPKDLPQQKEA